MSRKKVVAEVIKENINESSLDELMGERFGIYAKDVIQERAIPDARDGLKPVQRRIIFDMWNTGNTIEKPTKKSAHIVGDVMGKYHPHGDSSIYEALAHLSQNWRLRYPLVDFQGNNGSMDGDDPAAPRYTEARLSAISNELTRDIEMDTVDMGLTYDDSQYEPTVLPARFPNLFANGSSGIAVGLATEIPPHNLREIDNAIIYRIKHRTCDIEALTKYVPGPDFPTGGIIYRSESLKSIYLTGRGRINVASRASIIDGEDGKQIIVTEIPFGVNKSQLVFQIDKLRHDKTVAGIEEVRDESDKNGLRIAIDLKDDAKPEALLKYLMSKTDLMTSYTANMVAIVDGRPKTLNLLSYADEYISHQMDVITRRSNFLLKKQQSRLEIVDGLIKAVSILNEVVEVIKKSKDKADSKINISAAFGFTPDQAEAIVMMPLYKLSHTDITILEEEKTTLENDITYLKGLLSDTSKIEEVIIKDLQDISKKYGDNRRSEIADEEKVDLAVDKRDLIAHEDCYLVMSRDGYIKRSSLKSWKGSGGQNGVEPGVKPGDVIVYKGLVNTIDYFLAFTNEGNYLYVPVNEVKEAKWNDIGGHINSLVSLPPNEKIVRCFGVRHFRDDLYVILLSRHGLIKRISLASFPVARRNRPICGMKLSEDDTLVDATITTGNSDLFVASANGTATFYNENELSITNTHSGGMKAGSFKGADTISVLAFAPEEKTKIILLTDRAHTRVFDLSHIEKTERLKKPTLLYSTFKSEPHFLIYASKVTDQVLPYTLSTILTSGETYDVVFQDFYLTPMEKYAKRPDNFLLKWHIAYVSREDSDLVTDEIKSYPLPIKEETNVEASNEEEKKANFEQISLFGDDDDDKN
jgi:topoisomerase-4 subunit A